MFYAKKHSTVRPYRVDVSVCNSFIDRLTGALVEGEISYRSGFLLPIRTGVHTFFMRSSIAVLMFDREGYILRYRPKVPPFRIVRAPSETAGILELAPDRLDAVDAESEETRIFFEPSVAEESGVPGLSHES